MLLWINFTLSSFSAVWSGFVLKNDSWTAKHDKKLNHKVRKKLTVKYDKKLGLSSTKNIFLNRQVRKEIFDYKTRDDLKKWHYGRLEKVHETSFPKTNSHILDRQARKIQFWTAKDRKIFMNRQSRKNPFLDCQEVTFFVTQRWTKSFLSKHTVVSQNGDICSTVGKNVFSRRVSTSSLAFEFQLIVHYQQVPHVAFVGLPVRHTYFCKL